MDLISSSADEGASEAKTVASDDGSLAGMCSLVTDLRGIGR